MLKQNNLFIGAALVASLLLAGCSQSDGHSSSKVNATGGEVINGHTLPPEPDPSINNASLLGVDSNGNGVRDDVERKIYLEHNKEIDRQMLMMSAKREQRWLAAPDLIENAKEWQKLVNSELGCLLYIKNNHAVNLFKLSTQDDVFNTKKRIRKYMEYNRALSGGVYSIKNSDEAESSCDFNVTKAIEAK